MYTRRFAGGAAAVALALFAAACADTPTTPTAARAAGGRALLSSGSGPALVSTAVKYRDTGGKPARGRSGNAEVDALALLDRDGVTTLQFGARHATEWWRSGSISKAQVKASAPDGQHKFTRNVTGSASSLGPRGPVPGMMQLPGLVRGDEVQLQANVEGIDPHRVDVVTVTETVKRLPDLAVELSAPAEVEAGTPLNVLAVVREGNGDMGASGTCELYVAGERVDLAHGVWVDAGDVVTCAMTWTPGAPGTYPLEARITSAGREWDTANNTDTATLQVNGASPRFYTAASFSQRTTVDSSVVFSSWRDAQAGTGGEHRREDVWTESWQEAFMYGYTPVHLTGTVEVQASMSTGGRVVQAATWTLHAGDYMSWCTDQWDGPVIFWMCSAGEADAPYTDFTYSYVAGSVTYHSQGYSRTWDQLANPEESVYHWNDEYSDAEFTLGDDWTFDVRLNTMGAEHVLSETVQLVRGNPWGWSQPYSCSAWEYPDWTYSGTDCGSRSFHEVTITGSTGQ